MARILLGVTGSIAAYKAVELLRLASKAGHQVRVVQTPASLEFVGQETFAAISGAPVLIDEFEGDPMRGAYPGEDKPTHDPISHLELVARADCYVVAPASANTLAKFAVGIADSLVTSSFLACKVPVIVAPAMNNAMWRNKATAANIKLLLKRGIHIVEPDVGSLASKGEWGVGRLAQPRAILRAVEALATSAQPRSMDGLKVLVTAGGTREAIDQVRFIGNRSSGRMGYELAEEAFSRGADVTVLSANVTLDKNPAISYIETPTAKAMLAAANEQFIGADVLLMTAAVADYRPSKQHQGKIGKDQGLESIELVENSDIIATLASCRRAGQVIVGFAAEYGGEGIERARSKLERKQVDAIVVNDISRPDVGFETEDNEVTVVDQNAEHTIGKRSKGAVAVEICNYVEGLRREHANLKIR